MSPVAVAATCCQLFWSSDTNPIYRMRVHMPSLTHVWCFAFLSHFENQYHLQLCCSTENTRAGLPKFKCRYVDPAVSSDQINACTNRHTKYVAKWQQHACQLWHRTATDNSHWPPASGGTRWIFIFFHSNNSDFEKKKYIHIRISSWSTQGALVPQI